MRVLVLAVIGMFAATVAFAADKPVAKKHVVPPPAKVGGKAAPAAKGKTAAKPVARPGAKAPVAKPVRPAPVLPVVTLSPADNAAATLALRAMDAGKWDEARAYAQRAASDIPLQIVTWAWLQRPGNGAGFAEISRFLDTHEDWPNRDTIVRRAEEAMDPNMPDEQILAWFDKRPPMTGEGRFRLAEALFRAGRQAEGLTRLRDAWANGNFAARDESDLFRKYDYMLTADDHWLRLDRLLWDRQVEPAKRMLARVSPGRRAVAEARLALITRTGNIDRLLAQVPADLINDGGLAFERLRWRREKGLTDRVEEILLAPPGDAVKSERWWNERQVRARSALAEGRISDAYRLAANHGFLDNRNLVEAEWLAGWIALRFLNEADRSVQHFLTVFQAAKFPVSRARAAYWTGRAAEALNDAERAQQWYVEASQYPTTFYGQIALVKLNRAGPLDLPPDPAPTAAELAAFEKRSVVRATRALAELNQADRLRPFILRLEELSTTPEQHALVASFARAIGRIDLAVAAAKRAGQAGVVLVDGAFPLVPALSATASPEPAIVLALSRQESEFNQYAVSPAGARGLMQLMPATAREVARGAGIGYQLDWLTSNPDYNAKLGSRYVAQLLGNFDGNLPMAFAAYNAGEGRVRKWVKDWGDPRLPAVDVIDWIELIPFSETRNYVQRVLEGVQVYRHRLAPAGTSLQLASDLRGRNSGQIASDPTVSVTR